MPFVESIMAFLDSFLSGTGLDIVKALAILVVGLIVVSIVTSIVRSITIKNRRLDNAASSFITSLVKIILYVLIVIVILSTVGMDTASLIAAFSAVALAISLGLQDTLAGLTNGILIIFTKPFKQGDYVNIGGTEGTVKEIRLFNTKLTTPDNLDIIVPNSKVLSSDVINYSAMPLRRIDITVPVPYDTEVETVKKVLMECLEGDERIVSIPAPMCRLNEYGSSSLNYIVRCWVANGQFWDVKFDLNERIFTHLRERGIEIPFDQLDVHVIPSANQNKEEA
ncbi:MAG: mechanosensitive ion channel [Clostridia bacterium]|nr:mechanosensitive ion channel [Clostridia bacterium]